MVLIGFLTMFLSILIHNTKYPEKIFSRRFDCFGNSHNIMHVISFIGILVNFIALMKVFSDRSFKMEI